MGTLSLCELLILKEELKCSIDGILQRGFAADDRCVCMNFEKSRYKNLVRMYEKVSSLVLDIIDDLGKVDDDSSG